MNLTNELLEMWEADARSGHTDITAANARILHLIAAEHETAKLLAYVTAKLIDADPVFEEIVASALLETMPDAA